MDKSNFKTKLYTSIVILALTIFFVYLFYDDKKIEDEVDTLIDIHYRINQNFDICYTAFEDIIDIWDDNYYKDQFEINSKIDEYLNVNSINSKIDEERKRNQQYINKTLVEIAKIKFRDKSVYKKLQFMNSLSKQYCSRVLNYKQNDRDGYPESVLPLESDYFEVYSEVNDIIDYYGY